MALQTHGDYAGYTTPGGIRFQYKGKLISAKAVPPEVVSLLTAKVTGQRGEVPKSKPTPEQLAAIKAEQLAPKPGLEAAAEKLAIDAANAAEKLTAADFDEPPEDPTPAEAPLAEAPLAEAPPEPESTNKTLYGEEAHVVDPSFLETVSVHSAALEDIAQALYNRFGIYTVYLKKLPEGDEVNPLTGTQFTKYHLGIAYQAAIFAQNQGLLDRPAETGRRSLDEGRAASQNFKVDEVPQTMGQARRANSFDYRTSVRATESQPTTEIVHLADENGIVRAVQRVIPAGELGNGNGAAQRFDAEEDEPLVEPRFGKQVIRPDW